MVAGSEAQSWKRCMSLLQRCRHVRQLRAAHALFLAHGLHRSTYALSRLILAACSLATPAGLAYASLLLRRAYAPPNSFIYNTLIRATHACCPRRALYYFLLMLRSPAAAPDHRTYPFVLSACACAPSAGLQLHARVLRSGLASADRFVQTALLRLYARSPHPRDINDARRLFDEIPHRDAAHWDVLMNGYLHRGLSSEALCIFRDMLSARLEPDEFAVTTALTACARAGALEQGTWIHRYLEKKKPSFLSDGYVGSALVSMYAKCGCIGEAAKVFDAMPERNGHVWSALTGGYAMHGLARESVRCLGRMQEEDGLQPDGVVILNVLAACAHARLVEEGLHLLNSMEALYGVVPRHEHYSCAVDMLCRVGRLEDAVRLIGDMPVTPLASVWGSLLSGCRIHGNVRLAELAVEKLQRIMLEGGGDDEGVYVQLSNIYLYANKREDACRARKMIGSRGIKKTPACSVIEVNGQANSFVAGDQLLHPLSPEICRMLDLLIAHTTGNSLSASTQDLATGIIGC